MKACKNGGNVVPVTSPIYSNNPSRYCLAIWGVQHMVQTAGQGRIQEFKQMGYVVEKEIG